jgi:hypothetical protein
MLGRIPNQMREGELVSLLTPFLVVLSWWLLKHAHKVFGKICVRF